MTVPCRRVALFLLLASSAPQVLAAPQNTATTPIGQTYRSRAETIAHDLLWANSLLLQAFERYEDTQTAIEKPRRNTDAAALKAEADSAKNSLIAHMKTVQLNAARLQALSPVPRAWKRLDDSLVESAWEWSSALESMELWLQHPSDALKNESAKHNRRALALLDATRRKLWTLSEHTIASKKYAD